MMDLAYLFGAVLGFLGFSYLIRWSFLSFVKSWKGYPYAATILAIIGPLLSGIGSADGGPFNVSSMITQGAIGCMLMPLIWYVSYRRKEDYEYVSNGWFLGGLIWLLSILIFGGITFLSIITIINNPYL